MPLYRVEAFVEEALQSVLRQTYPLVELIVIDDCSPDKSLQRAEETIKIFNDKNYSVKFIRHPKNLGATAARINGVKAATGKWLLFLDSDDYWNSENFLEKVVNTLEEEGGDLMIFNYIELFQHSQRRAKLKEYTNSKDLVLSFFRGVSPAFLCNKCFLRERFMSYLSLWKEGDNMWEDMQIVPPYVQDCKKICYSQVPYLIYRRTNEHSITRDHSVQNVQSKRNVLQRLEDYFSLHLSKEDFLLYQSVLRETALTIEVGLLAKASYKEMCQILKVKQKEIYSYTKNFNRVTRYLLRCAILCYRMYLPYLSYLIIRLKECLQRMR